MARRTGDILRGARPRQVVFVMTLEGLSGIGTAVALVASTLWLVAEARAEVWEFDRSGKLIRQIGWTR